MGQLAPPRSEQLQQPIGRRALDEVVHAPLEASRRPAALLVLLIFLVFVDRVDHLVVVVVVSLVQAERGLELLHRLSLVHHLVERQAVAVAILDVVRTVAGVVRGRLVVFIVVVVVRAKLDALDREDVAVGHPGHAGQRWQRGRLGRASERAARRLV